jgi:DNA-binding YbaB/EbfC family protein
MGETQMMPKGMQGLMKQAQKVQQQMMKMQEELAGRLVNAQAGGGMVEATVNGRGELQALRLEPEVVDPEDVEMLCDLVVAAVGEAQRRAQEMMQEEMGKLTGGMNLPGMF